MGEGRFKLLLYAAVGFFGVALLDEPSEASSAAGDLCGATCLLSFRLARSSFSLGGVLSLLYYVSSLTSSSRP